MCQADIAVAYFLFLVGLLYLRVVKGRAGKKRKSARKAGFRKRREEDNMVTKFYHSKSMIETIYCRSISN